jgi:hypothetical protein
MKELSQELEENYEFAEIILTLLFAVIDLIIIIISLINLKSKNKNIYLLKYKLFSLFIVDIFLRTLYSINYHSIKPIFKEIVFSFLTCLQFFLILAFLEQAYNDTKLHKKGKFYNMLKRSHLCFIFFLVSFQYNKFTSSNFEICFIQSIIIIYCILVLYSRLKNKINKIAENLKIQTNKLDRKLFTFILGSPPLCLLFFISYYILRIISLFIENPEFVIYTNIILIIIKDSSKYFLFFILNLLLYAVSGVKMEKDKLTDDFVENNKVKVKQ